METNKSYYTLGEKASIAVVAKFRFKLLPREVIQVPNSYRKNSMFSSLITGGQLRKLNEAEVEDLVKNKGFRDVTNGRKGEVAAEEKTEPKKETPAGEEGGSEEKTPKVNTVSDYIQKTNLTELVAWMEELPDEVLDADTYSELSKLKIAPLRTALMEKLPQEFLGSVKA